MLLDYHLPKGDGLQLCYRIKQQVPAPAVIIFSAYASPELLLPAQPGQGRRGCSTRASARASCSRRSGGVAAGERLVGEPSVGSCCTRRTRTSPRTTARSSGMLLDGAPEAEAARTLGRPAADVRHAVQRTLSALRHNAPVAG